MTNSVRHKNSISSSEFNKLKNELDEKIKLREEIRIELQEANSLGDGPENFPLDAATAKQRVNERRIQELEGFLREVEIADIDVSSFKIDIGTEVEIEGDNGRKLQVKVVTPEMLIINKERGWISSDSELGKALLGKKVDDIITIETPLGKTNYKVLSI